MEKINDYMSIFEFQNTNASLAEAESTITEATLLRASVQKKNACVHAQLKSKKPVKVLKVMEHNFFFYLLQKQWSMSYLLG